MTAPGRRGRRSLIVASWWASILAAAMALATLIAIGSPGSALAADTYNQMTGIGNTSSALTVKWTSGLLNAENQPITGSSSTDGGTELSPNSDRASASPTSPLAFMYSDLKNLQVTVSQTADISHQGLTISWQGQGPASGPTGNYLQIMECWGDADTGPSPENCQFGSQNMLPSGVPSGVGQRVGLLCPAGAISSTSNPPAALDGQGGSWGCDPNEPTSAAVPHCTPGNPSGDECPLPDGNYEVPFVPVDDPTHPVYGQQSLLTEFNEFNSNEVQFATSQNGSGQLQFETLTDVEAPHLGCGALEDNGQPRGCWLVIVPRSTFEPNGYQPPGSGFDDSQKALVTSPLAASNWAQRIQIHLTYSPLGNACPPTVLPDQVKGTQVISRAMSSWELALNLAASCSTVYAFTATTESAATNAIQAAGPGDGEMAFTTIPIGSEATRSTGGPPPSMPGVLYAPVAVTATDFAFNIFNNTTPMELTPQLLARDLTQAYGNDLPDYQANNKQALPGPAWLGSNPDNITLDPAWQALNSVRYTQQESLAPLLPEDHTQLNQQVWQWIQSDPDTSSWLDTTPSTGPVQVDPDYVKLSPQLGAAPAPDSFPRAYSGVLDLGVCPPSLCPDNTKEEKLTSIDMLPYAPDIGSAAAQVLAGNDTALTKTFLETNVDSSNHQGWWSKVGVEVGEQLFMSTFSDMSDIAAYGLISAQLCDPSGANCVSPTLDSVAATLNAATPDTSGLLEIDPSKVPTGGYPLVQVVYAAVPTNLSAKSLTDYANLISYAANQGQATGSAPGDLPPGYLPLTSALQDQANSVVQQLRDVASPSATASATPTDSSTQTSSSTPTPSATPQATPAGGSTTAVGGTTGGTTTGGATAGGTTARGTTTDGTTTGGTTTSRASTTAGAQQTASPSPSTPRAAATCTSTPAASQDASPSATGAATLAPAGTGCSTSSQIAFSIVSPTSSAQLAGSTPNTVVGSVRRVLTIVLIIGVVGALGGTLLRFAPFTRRGPRRGRA